MVRVKTAAALLLFSSALICASAGHSEPFHLKITIPSDVPPDVRAQIERLYSPDAAECLRAIGALAKMGKGAALAKPFLIGLLNDGRTGVPDPPPAKGIVDIQPFTRAVNREAARALKEIGDPPVDELISAPKNREVWVVKPGSNPYSPNVQRENAVIALGVIGDPRATDALIGVLKDGSLMVRTVAVKALREREDARVADAMIGALGDINPKVRSEATEELGRRKERRAIEPLVAVLGAGLLSDEKGRIEYRRAIVEDDGEKSDKAALLLLAPAFFKEMKETSQAAAARFHGVLSYRIGLGWSYRWWRRGESNCRPRRPPRDQITT